MSTNNNNLTNNGSYLMSNNMTNNISGIFEKNNSESNDKNRRSSFGLSMRIEDDNKNDKPSNEKKFLLKKNKLNYPIQLKEDLTEKTALATKNENVVEEQNGKKQNININIEEINNYNEKFLVKIENFVNQKIIEVK